MKLVKIERGGRCAAGVLQGHEVSVVGEWQQGPAERAPFALSALSTSECLALADASCERVQLDAVQLVPPVDPRSKIICVGANYSDHVAEIGQIERGPPQVFLRHADTLVGHEEKIVRPRASSQLDFEGELAVVISRAGRHIRVEDALDHVLGYTCFMDGSVRDYQRQSVTAGKNFWRSGSMGPCIVTVDEAASIDNAELQTSLNGAVVQSTRVSHMVHGIAELIAYCSQWTPLAPGDVIATGTPSGIGSRRQPPLWLKSGDVLEVHIGGIGKLVNGVLDEAEVG